MLCVPRAVLHGSRANRIRGVFFIGQAHHLGYQRLGAARDFGNQPSLPQEPNPHPAPARGRAISKRRRGGGWERKRHAHSFQVLHQCQVYAASAHENVNRLVNEKLRHCVFGLHPIFRVYLLCHGSSQLRHGVLFVWARTGSSARRKSQYGDVWRGW